jgi:serine protease Do
MRKLIKLLVVLIIFLGLWSAFFNYSPQVTSYLNGLNGKSVQNDKAEQVKVITEESVTVNVVKKIGPSVVTIVEEAGSQPSSDSLQFGPFSIFGLGPLQQDNTPQNVGSGFIVSKNGLVVTSKHVVSDPSVKYSIITTNDKKYNVTKIYRDPLNDIAVLQVDIAQNSGNNLIPVELGNSSSLQVGQFVIAMGTALGEFKNTVTTGVISGLGRGITAGDQFAGFVEKLDNVIQTDAAINPGNSGGPLINSSGQVIGINTAIAQGGQNIGFALPVNILKDSLKNFNQSGQFNRAYLGVSYKMINKDVAIINDIVQGAYIQAVVKDSPAEKSGIKAGDVIIKFDGKKVDGAKDELSTLIAAKKAEDTVAITIWRNGKPEDLSAKLSSADNQ